MAFDEVFEKVVSLVVDITGEDEIRDEPDLDLFEDDILDSMAAIEVLVAIEEQFGVRIAPTEFERSEMNTLNKIAARVAERL